MKILCVHDTLKEITREDIEKYFSKNKQIDIKYKNFLLNVLNLKSSNLAFVMFFNFNHKNGNIIDINFSNKADHHIIFLSNQLFQYYPEMGTSRNALYRSYISYFVTARLRSDGDTPHVLFLELLILPVL